ncbi:MAG: 7-cyano-7-deazaguanine synthase [Nitrososphaeraceae archaeon]
MVSTKAVCILSGGLDSVVSAFYVKQLWNFVPYTITFQYGQRSTEEMKRARLFSMLLGSEVHKEIDIGFMKDLYGSYNTLTGKNTIIPERFHQSMVVPHRNSVFLTIGAAWAASQEIGVLVYGAHADDQNYPDCRPKFVSSLENMLKESDLDAINIGLRKRIEIWCPAKENIHKNELVRIGYDLLGNKIFDTWSCYSDGSRNSLNKPVHCGACESCVNRKSSFNEANIQDKTVYAT